MFATQKKKGLINCYLIPVKKCKQKDELYWYNAEYLGMNIGEEGEEVFIPGGGVAKRVYETCRSQGIHLSVLLKFSSEGDNSPDGLMLADYLNQLIVFKETDKKMNIPKSWRHLFGPPAPTQMFWW